jgi:hypothetical protein
MIVGYIGRDIRVSNIGSTWLGYALFSNILIWSEVISLFWEICCDQDGLHCLIAEHIFVDFWDWST